VTDPAAQKICPTCSAEYPGTERFCPKDGMALHWQAGAHTDLVGSVIADRYHVREQLGSGGMGRVYLAEHVRMGRQCAIKVLHPSMASDAEAISRFNREAANASRIDHPNVAAIYDFGETSDGLLYLAMQFVEGQTLTDVLKSQGALSPLRASDITRQAAEGLHAAHAMGIVHRDLKPDNIMVTTDGDGLDQVKVVDFGIAKATRERSRLQGVTRSGIVVGTPEYMSPEQLAGEEVDARSDTYSLALVAFNMLTGDLPFPSVSTATLARMRLTERPRALADAAPDVPWPDDVQAVMNRALERKPEARFASTREFARALHAAIAMMPARVSTVSTGKHAQPLDGALPESSKTVRTPHRVSRPAPSRNTARERKRIWITAGTLAAVLIVTVLLGGRSLFQRARANTALEQGVAAYRDGRQDEARERLTAASKDAPDDPAPYVYLSRLARERNDLTTANDAAVKAVRLGPNNGAALRELATTLYAMQNYSGARAFYARAVKADPSDHISQGYLGCSLIQLGRSDEGMRWIQRAGSGTWSACASEMSSVARLESR
jgi:serine/threonine protein kinase